MKKEDLYDGITDIKEDIIEQAVTHTFKGRRLHHRKWLIPVAAVLVFAIITGAVLWPSSNPNAPSILNSYAVVEAVYPERQPYPDDADYADENGEVDWEAYNAAQDLWIEERAQNRWDSAYSDNLNKYLNASIPTFLSTDGDENRVFSPLNVYMALGMLAELTDGDSRQQILDLTGANDMSVLRTMANMLWNTNYQKDGLANSLLASSLWLNQNISFKKDAMERLATTYYTSSYQGEMGSLAFNTALQDWLNTQTGGILKEQASSVEMSAETILSLATTVSFQAKWSNWFSEQNNTFEVFRTPGGDITCEFMHQSMGKDYYWGEKFTATSQALNSSGAMWFILPDEGVSVDELLADTQTMEFLLAGWEWENQEYITVNLSVPKFDVSSQFDLKDGLQALGVNDIFDAQKSDFTPMTEDEDEIFVSTANHAARVMIDEEGCTAAAFTVMTLDGTGGPPSEEVDFTLDRPFLFAITNSSGLPLFVGIVNQP